MQIIFRSKKVKIIVIIAGIVILCLINLVIGMMIGFAKARFSYDWGQNYERNFVNPPMPLPPFPGPQNQDGQQPNFKGPGFFPGMDTLNGDDFRNPHGIAGIIISVSDSQIVVKDKNNNENTISVNSNTLVKRGNDTITVKDLKQNDQVVVLGSPDANGVVNADLIRVFSIDDNNNN